MVISLYNVFILPMRDWNWVMGSNVRKVLATVFILPMRDWNKFVPYLVLRAFAVFILPMRDWNYSIIPYFSYSQKFLSYLWGIETIYGMSFWRTKITSFYLTYEGLKHEFNRMKEALQKRFYLTYEGLKLKRLEPVFSRFDRFYLTYEGLKLNSWCAHQFLAFCFYLTYEGLKLSIFRM